MADDYSPDRYTAGALRAGASLTGELETGGDVDWIKVRLQAGKTYRIDLEGVPTRAGTLGRSETARCPRLPDEVAAGHRGR